MRLAAAALVCAAACGGRSATTGGGEVEPVRQDPAVSDSDLARDLEATVLEGYSQLSLGNFEAYADTVAEDVELALVEIGPRDVLIRRRDRINATAFRLDPCEEVLSKNLEVHLSRDDSIGWTFDEVSCRLRDPFEGRVAAIPLRVTAVYQRYLDSWVLVMQHVSYPMPVEEVIAVARAGALRAPVAIEQRIEPSDGIRRTLRSNLRAVITNRGTNRARKIATDPGALALWPGPEHEYHGPAIRDAPTLEELFGAAATIEPDGIYIGLARNKQVAWVVANLRVQTVVSDDPLTIGLRATYVFERRDDTPGVWNIVQTHVSAPIVQGALTKRVFGLELPDLSSIPPPNER